VLAGFQIREACRNFKLGDEEAGFNVQNWTLKIASIMRH
jgi:hypothetical protein